MQPPDVDADMEAKPPILSQLVQLPSALQSDLSKQVKDILQTKHAVYKLMRKLLSRYISLRNIIMKTFNGFKDMKKNRILKT
ncbi:unnamed protein product [Protopolystoma xenopodis]|uniref:Uncharacterized protein n=1 Tax=Protopolystoma xenopodis TaxID=117903 RepID=A0A3S5AG24_9PLAT|nr:unnamed protein product [Protopolystoma xenopodis]